MFSNLDTAKIHFGYVVLILVATIVFLVTLKAVPAGQELVSYVSFASSVASLILAVLAIVLTFVASGSSSNILLSVQGAATELSKTAQTIDSTVEHLKALKDMPDQLRTVRDTVSETLRKINEQPKTTPSGALEKSLTPNAGVDAQVFLKLSSFMGLYGLYCCACAIKKEKKEFKFDDIQADILKGESNYMWGYLVAAHAAGIVAVSTKSGIWTVARLHESLSAETIRERILKRSESLTKDDKDTSRKQSYIDSLAAIDRFFS